MRRLIRWVGANAALAIALTVCYAIWLAVTGQIHTFTGTTSAGTARVGAIGGLLSVGTLLLLVVGTLLIANLAWVIVRVSRRRSSRREQPG